MLYLVDKPTGPSSNQTLSLLRRYFHTKKAGHSGTLDPLASGLLIVATNGSTKILPLMKERTKRYEFTLDLSLLSDSLDLGTPTYACDPPIDHIPPIEEILRALAKFRGVIQQVPPAYSAISIDGKRSYSEARKGNAVEMPSREATVYELELTEYAFPKISLKAHVSSGAYVRSLARDIGAELGGGGVVTRLGRVGIDDIRREPEKMEYLELHPGELTGIEAITYDRIFPEIGRIDLTKREFDDISYGHAIAKRGEFTGERVF
jgi:tRNA pseudouridine55 synthase